MYNERFGSQSGQVENVWESVGTLTNLLGDVEGREDSLGKNENVGTPSRICQIHKESRGIKTL
ncbi:hypothetical protein CH367_19320 [Leptospira barantonii]|uniref:Uncharacterized protein n=1 Tax=Leptospira barantonii TaxID=2023184 RepID=A0ABX4NI13_9LEPT|nr:hypothetical protein CH367_19320 [Leptospira barantonii]